MHLAGKGPNKRTLLCFYVSIVLFIRSFFLKERPLFVFFIITIYPLLTLFFNLDPNWSPFVNMRLLLSLGFSLIAMDSLSSSIATHISKYPYLIEFFNNRDLSTLKGQFLAAGWSALIIGRTPMTASGRAAIAAAFVSGGVYLYNSHLQRVHEAAQTVRQHAHENEQAMRQRAYANYTYARDQYDKAYIKKGPKPTWSEQDYKVWVETKK
jgi:hypothetical protein